MPDKIFIEELRSRLSRPLPGLKSQLRMANIKRIKQIDQMKIPDDVSRAAVLVLLFPVDGNLHLAFMRRPEYGGVHSGQISFPGGKEEDIDKDLLDTALRETREEFGFDTSEVDILGQLSDLFIPPSNFKVAPFVGYISAPPIFHPDPEEVDEILVLPLEDFINKESLVEKEINVGASLRIKVPCFYIEGHIIWGATAMMMSEFLVLVKEAKS